MVSRFLLSILIISLYSCQIIDQPEIAPSFVHIQDFEFIINHSGQGSNSEDITDAWIYVNGNLEGVYELPATIPLHYDGTQELSIYPGIKRNGISGDRKKYPFYEVYSIEIMLYPDSIINLSPTTQYEDPLFMWIEDFEDPQSKLTSFATSDTDIQIIDQQSGETFEGDAGAINMDTNNIYCELRTNELDFNQFPKNINVPAYMEMNYANNYPFTIGILHKDGTLSSYTKQPLITMHPTSSDTNELTWNKTYLYLSDVTNFFPSATEFDIYISASNYQQQNNIKIRLDNIKVIYRQ